MSDVEYIKEAIQQHTALADAVEDLIRVAQPIYSGNDNTVLEWVVDGPAYDKVVGCLDVLQSQKGVS